MAQRRTNPRVAQAIQARLVRGAEVASVWLRQKIMVSISRPNPDGSNPSAPSEPPKRVTGTLRSSIAQDVRADGSDVVARIGTNVPYGRYLEQGTRKMAARPYLRPALQHAQEFRRILIRAARL